MDSEQQAFIDTVLPDAKVAAHALGIPTSAVLAQWADETGWGTSELYRDHNALAGVSTMTDDQRSVGAYDIPGTAVLGYPDRNAATEGYVNRWKEPVYGPTRELWSRQNDAVSVAQAMQASPWAAGHYNNGDLVHIIDTNNLRAYDAPEGGGGQSGGGGGETPPTPTEPPCTTLTPGPAPEGKRTLKIGMHGEDVAALQLALRAFGIVCANSFKADGQPDGIYGPGTAAGVVEYQLKHGVHPDGIVGRQTWCTFGYR